MSDAGAKTIDPLVKRVVVPLPVSEAFDLFTSKMASWWPLKTHSVAKEQAVACRLESRVGGRVYEVDDAGRECLWGTVDVWQPPERVVFSWHPGRDTGSAQEVEVRFFAAPEGTAVRLEHRSWETLGDAAAETRFSYDTGWDFTLGCMVDAAGSG
ncbi:MAG: SRPBCC family protein [Actinomycetota bacterium]|nr:SRPBCC family protein [Actinomycetota bacterium]